MYLFWQAKLVQFCATVKGASWTNPDEMTPLNHQRHMRRLTQAAKNASEFSAIQ
jgi:hypothetical protein